MRGGFVFGALVVSALMATKSQLIEFGLNDEIGQIMRPDRGPAQVTFTDFFPTHDFDDGFFGEMRAVIRGVARRNDVFFTGTSGSTWRINNGLAGIQFAAEPGLRIGYAKAAFAIAKEWLSKQFNMNARVHRSF